MRKLQGDNWPGSQLQVVGLRLSLAKEPTPGVTEGCFEKDLEATTGFEPVNDGFAIRCLTTWPRRQSRGVYIRGH